MSSIDNNAFNQTHIPQNSLGNCNSCRAIFWLCDVYVDGKKVDMMAAFPVAHIPPRLGHFPMLPGLNIRQNKNLPNHLLKELDRFSLYIRPLAKVIRYMGQVGESEQHI
ncbi:hypothetical protein [Mastigocladopsis repens]|uniref:hypothetical protein n=1 Tax=Mastigocladopsis repens TaxID=221287 RepID=UPI0003664CBC|nr:hypothetical protein [Mastigocladopsis repens]